MKILNLVDESNSDIKYKKIPFPDGQQNIVITKIPMSIWDSKNNESLIVQIKSRLNNWLDLELITCAAASLHELGVEEIHLYVPYIMGARSDRKFEEGGNNYLKDVICPIINSLKFKTVTCIDPHSDVLEACIKGFRKLSNLELVKFTFKDLNDINNKTLSKGVSGTLSLNNYILISPDAGANKKIYKLAEQIGYKGDIITCSKDRDTNGKLTKTVVPLTEPYYSKDFVIIDDICDGGATFINIVKEIQNVINKMDRDYKPKIYLIVTHGIFSKGFNELAQYFDGIYCTNSYSELSSDWKYTDSGVGNFIKQLNVY